MFGNWNDAVLDEIALEGLDGLTLEGLWNRLSERLKIPLPFTAKAKTRFWEVARHLKHIQAFELPEPRPFFIFDRYQNVEPDFGIVMDPDEIPVNIYPYYPVKDNYIQGSCKHFETRVDRTDEIRNLKVEEVEEKYPKKIVLVASQDIRYNTLVNTNYHINLTAIQYCILERIGRSRHVGEVTVGKVSLQDIGESAKSLFYHRKILIQYKLITKQAYHYKVGSGHSCGCLLHLPRFYVERKPKNLIVIEEVVEILKNTPNGLGSYEDVRNYFVDNVSFKKIWKTIEFQKVIRTDVRVMYKDLYPDSTKDQYLTKNGAQKFVRCFQLIDRNVDLNEVWLKEEVEEDDEQGLLNNNDTPLDMPLMMHALKLINDQGRTGLTQNELSEKMGTNRLNARTICRNLVRRKCITFFVDNVGRQRVTKFISKNFVRESGLQEVFNEHDILSANKMEIENSNGLAKKRERSDSEEEKPLAKMRKLDVSETVEKEAVEAVVEENVVEENPTELVTSEDSQGIITTVERIYGIPGFKLDLPSVLDHGKSWRSKTDTKGAITYKFLCRMNFILEYLREFIICHDLSKLRHYIDAKENTSTNTSKVDKKTLYRLMFYMQREGHLKVYRVVLTLLNKARSVMILTLPHCTVEHELIQSELDRMKMYFFMTKTQFNQSKLPEVEPNFNQLVEFSNDSCFANRKEQIKYMNSIYKKSAGKTYGYRPRFMRLQVIHQFLYYLIYEQEENCGIPKAEAIKSWKNKDCLTPELLEELPDTLYSNEINWKMFIAPVVRTADMPKGWLLACDMFYRVPINTFVKVVRFPYDIPELDEILNHPIKKHYIIKQLPASVRSCLLFKRRYVFSMFEVFTKLSYIGLLQFGPQRLKEKDQQFIYLNRKAMVVDTRASERGYNQTEVRDYPVLTFEFHSFSDVEKYWYELWMICVHTYLGMRRNLHQKSVVLIENPDFKPSLVKYTTPRQPTEAVENDCGYIPGDGRGAAGIDSSLYPHLRRSWSWPALVHKTGATTPVVVNKPVTSREIPRTKRRRYATQVIQTFTEKPKQPKKPFAILPRRTQVMRQPLYDEVDREALKHMNKLRVDWSADEDRILLLSRVANLYILETIKKPFLIYQTVRDCLHRLLQTSINKTSRACQRRINYMMKNTGTEKSVSIFLEDLKQCPHVRRFLIDVPKEKIKIGLVVLIGILIKKFGREQAAEPELEIPDTIQEFVSQYNFYAPAMLKADINYKNPEDEDEIRYNNLISIIHSAMCLVGDKNNWTFQLMKVYQNFPEMMVRQVMLLLHRYEFMAIKKSLTMKPKMMKFSLTTAPYNLSQKYRYKILTRPPFEIYHECFLRLQELQTALDNTKNEKWEVPTPSGGSAAAFLELNHLYSFDIELKIPEHAVLIDPRLKKNHDVSVYNKICAHFRHILQGRPFSPTNNEELDSTDKQNSTEQEPEEKTEYLLLKSEEKQTFSTDDTVLSQHLHDVLVLKASGLFLNLEEVREKLNSQRIVYENDKKLISNIQRFINIPKEKPKTTIIPDLIKTHNGNEEDIQLCYQIIDFTEIYLSLGITAKNLREKFAKRTSGSLSLVKILQILVESKILLRCGVTDFTFVHFKHSLPWQTRSYKLTRANKERIQNKSAAQVAKETAEQDDEEIFTKSRKVTTNTFEEVMVIMFPWIRVDGTINRRVLDRWMGAILSYCIDKPGVTVSRLCKRFVNLKPVECMTLVEYLEEIGCIEKIKVLSNKISLIDDLDDLKIVPATILDDFDEICIETLPDCVTKLALFIGKKQYKNDFLSST